MHRIAIAIVCLLTGCTSVEAGGPDERTVLARRLLETQYGPAYMTAMGQAYADEYVTRLPDYGEYCETAANAAYCRISAAGMTAEIKRVVTASVTEIADLRFGIIEKLTPVYAEAYTTEELRAAVAFAESPAGRSIEAKAGPLMSRAAAIHYDAMRPWNDALDIRVEAIVYMFSASFASSEAEQ